MTTADKVRAVRNNNPGNIERGDKWQGLMKLEDMTSDQRSEVRFCVFAAPKWGFRAMAVILITYYDKREGTDGSRIDTIKEVIERWAPNFENNVTAYIRSVDKRHPKTSIAQLDLHDYRDLRPLVKAMATHEAGGWYWSNKDLDEGLMLAGVLRSDVLIS